MSGDSNIMGIIVRNMSNFSNIRIGTNDYHEIIENTNFCSIRKWCDYR